MTYKLATYVRTYIGTGLRVRRGVQRRLCDGCGSACRRGACSRRGRGGSHRGRARVAVHLGGGLDKAETPQGADEISDRRSYVLRTYVLAKNLRTHTRYARTYYVRTYYVVRTGCGATCQSKLIPL